MNAENLSEQPQQQTVDKEGYHADNAVDEKLARSRNGNISGKHEKLAQCVIGNKSRKKTEYICRQIIQPEDFFAKNKRANIRHRSNSAYKHVTEELNGSIICFFYKQVGQVHGNIYV
jgi:hypothetical protein